MWQGGKAGCRLKEAILSGDCLQGGYCSFSFQSGRICSSVNCFLATGAGASVSNSAMGWSPKLEGAEQKTEFVVRLLLIDSKHFQYPGLQLPLVDAD